MKNLGEFIGNFTVEDEYNDKKFIVYFYENGITFDDKFLKFILEKEELSQDLLDINNSWKNKSKNKEEIISSIMEVFSNYELDFFHFSKEEINRNALYYHFLKEKDLLTKITRKEFESKILSEKVGEYYTDVLNDTKENSEFYTYTSEVSGIDFYLMVVDDKIKIGFPEEIIN